MWNVNVTDTISWQGHHDRVMQLNWLYFCGIYQMMPLKVWPNTALDCNHQSICMPQVQPLCSAALVPTVLPPKGWRLGLALRRDRSLIVYWPPLRIRTRAAGFKIVSGDHYTTTAHIVLDVMVQIWTTTQIPSWSLLKSDKGMRSVVTCKLPQQGLGGARDANGFSSF